MPERSPPVPVDRVAGPERSRAPTDSSGLRERPEQAGTGRTRAPGSPGNPSVGPGSRLVVPGSRLVGPGSLSVGPGSWPVGAGSPGKPALSRRLAKRRNVMVIVDLPSGWDKGSRSAAEGRAPRDKTDSRDSSDSSLSTDKVTYNREGDSTGLNVEGTIECNETCISPRTQQLRLLLAGVVILLTNHHTDLLLMAVIT